jgi:hypothetical protein
MKKNTVETVEQLRAKLAALEAQEAPIEGEYKGIPTLTFNGGKPFSLGVRKLQRIVMHLDTVNAFIGKHNK